MLFPLQSNNNVHIWCIETFPFRRYYIYVNPCQTYWTNHDQIFHLFDVSAPLSFVLAISSSKKGQVGDALYHFAPPSIYIWICWLCAEGHLFSLTWMNYDNKADVANISVERCHSCNSMQNHIATHSVSQYELPSLNHAFCLPSRCYCFSGTT